VGFSDAIAFKRVRTSDFSVGDSFESSMESNSRRRRRRRQNGFVARPVGRREPHITVAAATSLHRVHPDA